MVRKTRVTYTQREHRTVEDWLKANVATLHPGSTLALHAALATDYDHKGLWAFVFRKVRGMVEKAATQVEKDLWTEILRKITIV